MPQLAVARLVHGADPKTSGGVAAAVVAAAGRGVVGRGGDLRQRAAYLSQAGNAWLLAGNGARAVASLRSALTLSAGDADLFADLGRADAMLRNWKDAVLDLNAAINLRRAPDLLVLSFGADTWEGDPISHFKLTTADYAVLARDIAAYGWPTVVAMEGGYAIDALGSNVVSLLGGLE